MGKEEGFQTKEFYIDGAADSGPLNRRDEKKYLLLANFLYFCP